MGEWGGGAKHSCTSLHVAKILHVQTRYIHLIRRACYRENGLGQGDAYLSESVTLFDTIDTRKSLTSIPYFYFLHFLYVRNYQQKQQCPLSKFLVCACYKDVGTFMLEEMRTILTVSSYAIKATKVKVNCLRLMTIYILLSLLVF